MDNDNTKENGKFIISLSRAMRSVHHHSLELFRQNGLTMAQFAALEALYHKGDLSVGALIDAVLSTSGNMTVVIRNLEQHGLVFRKENPTDRRSFLISLTKSGETLIADVFEKHMALVDESLSPITKQERDTVIHILKKLQSI